MIRSCEEPCLVANGRGFWELYEQACLQANQLCSSRVRKALDNEVSLEIDISAIRDEQWPPLLDALGKCDSLREIGIINRSVKRIGASNTVYSRSDKDEEAQKQAVCQRLIKSLSVHLWNSMALTHLYLKNLSNLIPHVNILKSNKFVKALARNDSLRILWIEDCQLSEADISAICKALHVSTLTHLSLIQCGLNHKSVGALTNLIKRHKHNRRGQTSKPCISEDDRSILGLRRINLSRNPDLKDKGFIKLCKVLETDSWIRAIEVQDCALTDNIWPSLESLIQLNDGILLIDVRFNGLNERLTSSLIAQMETRQSLVNNKYEWQPSLHFVVDDMALAIPSEDDDRHHPLARKRFRMNGGADDTRLRWVAERRIRQLEADLIYANEKLKIEYAQNRRTKNALQQLLIDLRKLLQSKQPLERGLIEQIFNSSIQSCKWLRVFELELSPSESSDEDDSDDAIVLRNLLSGIEGRRSIE